MVRLRGTRPVVKAKPKLRVTAAQVPPPGYVAGAGVRPGLKMDWSRELQAFFQYGAAAQLPDPAAQLPDLGISAAERCNDNCMHASTRTYLSVESV